MITTKLHLSHKMHIFLDNILNFQMIIKTWTQRRPSQFISMVGEGDECVFATDVGMCGGKCEWCKAGWCPWRPIWVMFIPIADIWCKCCKWNDGSNLGLTSSKLDRFEALAIDMLFMCDWLMIIWLSIDVGVPVSSFFFCLRDFARLFWN